MSGHGFKSKEIQEVLTSHSFNFCKADSYKRLALERTKSRSWKHKSLRHAGGPKQDGDLIRNCNSNHSKHPHSSSVKNWLEQL